MILSGGLETRSEDSPSRTSCNGSYSAYLLTNPSSEQSSDQCSKIVHTNNATLQQRIGNNGGIGMTVNSLSVSKPHPVDVLLSIVYTTHHTLVIAKEEDGQACNAVDGNEKLALLELVGNIPSSDLIPGEVDHGDRRDVASECFARPLP